MIDEEGREIRVISFEHQVKELKCLKNIESQAVCF